MGAHKYAHPEFYTASENDMKYEHRTQRIIPLRRFIRRLARSAGIAGAIILTALAAGICGYHFLGGLAWIDALVDASMILSGMGPVNELHGTPGKLFAAAYALFSGMVFLTVAAVLFAPVVHRLLHRFHLEAASEDEDERRTQRRKPHERA